MVKSLETLYPKDCPYFEVGKELSDALEAIVSAYNEFVIKYQNYLNRLCQGKM